LTPRDSAHYADVRIMPIPRACNGQEAALAAVMSA